MKDVQLRFEATRLNDELQQLRKDVRHLITTELNEVKRPFGNADYAWEVNKRFAKKVAERGWIGMTWPRKYGGQERSFLERFVVNEEMQAARAPVGAYFVADRQSGPTLIKYGSDYVKNLVLPKIVTGDLCFCIGMSEPNSGSDLFAAQTKATKIDGGWSITGGKIWTTNAQHADYMIGLFRTAAPSSDNRRFGLTSFLVDMHRPGIEVRPILQMNGEREFNEVHFNDVHVNDEYVIGNINEAWKQATTELAFERSGPERFLETFPSLVELVRVAAATRQGESVESEVGRLVAQLHSLRRMSVAVAGLLESGAEPIVEASMVKDLGTLWEQKLPLEVRGLLRKIPDSRSLSEDSERIVNYYIKTAPKLTIQGGTTEILRGIIARGLGLR